MDWIDIPWWGWMVFGILLAFAELVSPGGFYFIFFGVSAVVVGALAGLGLLAEPWLEIALFPIIAIVALMLFRKPVQARFTGNMPNIPVDSLVGEVGTALEDIQPVAYGKVELRGAAWNAKNAGNQLLARGQRCKVERVDGLSLWVRTE